MLSTTENRLNNIHASVLAITQCKKTVCCLEKIKKFAEGSYDKKPLQKKKYVANTCGK